MSFLTKAQEWLAERSAIRAKIAGRPYECPECKGAGVREVLHNDSIVKVQCTTCKGAGRVQSINKYSRLKNEQGI